MPSFKILSPDHERKSGFRLFLIAVGILSVVSIAFLIVGVVLYQSSVEKCQKNEPTVPSTNSGTLNQNQQNLLDFLTKTKAHYFQLNPNEKFFDPEATDSDVLRHFTPYDPSWQAIKKRTDAANKLGEELKQLKINRAKLRPREKKGLAQLEHYLYSIFGKPYDENYYAGDWMMGPNYFCWQQICSIYVELGHLSDRVYYPKSVEDVERVMEVIKKFKTTIETYRGNMELGVKAGMARSVEDCKSGVNVFKGKFPKIVDHGPSGKFVLIFFAFFDSLIEVRFRLLD